jgi:hypothetical protein
VSTAQISFDRADEQVEKMVDREAQRQDARLMAAAFAAEGFGRPRLRAVPDFNPPAQA